MLELMIGSFCYERHIICTQTETVYNEYAFDCEYWISLITLVQQIKHL